MPSYSSLRNTSTIALVAMGSLVLILLAGTASAAPYESTLTRRDNGRCECYSSDSFKYKDGSAAKCQHPINFEGLMGVWPGADWFPCGPKPGLDQICCDEDACGDEHNCGGVRDGQGQGFVYGIKS